jgi:membrane protease YdiL (CAAX protease family)
MHFTPLEVTAEAFLLFPLLALAFFGEPFRRAVACISLPLRLGLPALAAVPYYLVAHSRENFRWSFVGIYAVLPFLLVILLWDASRRDPEQRGGWRDFLVLLILGVVVEFKLFERAWPTGMGSFNRLILLDTAVYGFLVIRQLTNVGFHFVPRLSDVKIGLRELAFYAPIAVPLGLSLGFLHWHAMLPSFVRFALSWLALFAVIAVLEETYFRGLLQNLLERRIGPRWALLATAPIFGLSHFNKGATHFNWRYVLLATFAGIFYGRAWRAEHRLTASAITHASVDTIWSIWLK